MVLVEYTVCTFYKIVIQKKQKKILVARNFTIVDLDGLGGRSKQTATNTLITGAPTRSLSQVCVSGRTPCNRFLPHAALRPLSRSAGRNHFSHGYSCHNAIVSPAISASNYSWAAQIPRRPCLRTLCWAPLPECGSGGRRGQVRDG